MLSMPGSNSVEMFRNCIKKPAKSLLSGISGGNAHLDNRSISRLTEDYAVTVNVPSAVRRFGGLAAVLLLLAALFLAFGSGSEPAAAQTTDPLDTTMSVGAQGSNLGFSEGNFGTLGDTTFTINGKNYSINQLYVHTGSSRLFLKTTPQLTDANFGRFKLIVDDVEFISDDFNSDGGDRFRASLKGLSLTSGGSVTVKIVLFDDKAALVALYDGTGGSSWVNKTNWKSDKPIGEWFGVTVNDSDRVTELRLPGNITKSGFPKSAIPAELGNLTKLEHLDFSENSHLGGALPTELGNLSSLKTLNLSWFNGDGGIPAEFGNLSSLESLIMSPTLVGGSIPPELGNLSSLKTLNLQNAYLTGAIPSELGNLSSLEYLNLSYNRLGGRTPDNRLGSGIPSELGNLTNLVTLDLRNNQLRRSGIPTTFGNLTKLENLLLSNNQLLSGSLPKELGNMTSLKKMEMARISVGGAIPKELGNLTNLESFHLDSNGLSGSIPKEMANMSSLTELNIRNNSLNGALPAEIGNFASLETLALTGNSIPGAIPGELGNLSTLKLIQLGDNNLSGNIPLDLGSLSNLEVLDLRKNELTGSIPSQLGNLAKLKQLHLSENDLTSAIPEDLGKLTELTILNIGYNNLGARLPDELQNLTKLTQIYIQETEVSGPFPDWLNTTRMPDLRELSIYGNNLNGVVNSSIAESTNITYLAYAENDRLCAPDTAASRATKSRIEGINRFHYFGELMVDRAPLEALYDGTDGDNWSMNTNWKSDGVPLHQWAGVETDEECRVTKLWLGNKGLSGTLPAEVGNLIELENLYLEANELTGSIPVELGSLTNLERLYLQSNGLSDEVPSELTGLSSLIRLYLYGNELTGKLPDGLRNIETLTWLRTNNNAGLCAPETAEFQAFLEGLEYWMGDACQPDDTAERAALAAIYDALGGDNWHINTNWKSDKPLKDWHGLTVVDSSVVQLGLGNNNLTGSIPAEIGNLPNLERLTLWNNNLTGSIPAELGSLTKLEQIHLAENGLSGSIPSELGNLTNLMHLNLYRNSLSGAVPAELGSLTSLKGLDLNNNNLSGSLPSEWSGMTSLVDLVLYQNDFSGSLPSDWSRMSSLVNLVMYDNKLTGNVPSTWSNLSNLEWLSIGWNELSGELPVSLTSLPALESFYFARNNGLCAPDTKDFRDMDAEIRNFYGPFCTDTPPAGIDADSGDEVVGLSWDEGGEGEGSQGQGSKTMSSFVSLSRSIASSESGEAGDPNQEPIEDKDPTSIQYDVSYTKSDAGWNAGSTVSVTSTSATITGLENGVSYQFRVRKNSAEEASDWSESVTATPGESNPATLIDAFDDIELSEGETVSLDMTDHFSGDGLTYEVMVTTTNQKTGKQKTGALNEVARNKVSGEWSGTVLTLTAGGAALQSLTIEITTTDENGGTASDDFTFSLVEAAEPGLPGTPVDAPNVSISWPSDNVSITVTLRGYQNKPSFDPNSVEPGEGATYTVSPSWSELNEGASRTITFTRGSEEVKLHWRLKDDGTIEASIE